MQLLAIDPGTHCGWASWDGRHVESGVQIFDVRRGESPGMRFVRFRAWLNQLAAVIDPQVVVYELAHHRGGAATEVLVGMTTRIQECAAEHKAEHVGVHTATLKKRATGKGRASKEAMVAAACKEYHMIVTDDNEADALLLLSWAREEYDPPPRGPYVD